MADTFDAVVVGSGPNGLAAAIELAREGFRVRVVEAIDRPGGRTQTRELTLPGFLHDESSAAHPLGALSPFLGKLPLHDFGLEWLAADASVAHPLDEGYAVLLYDSLQRTADGLTRQDNHRWRKLFRPFMAEPHALLEDLLGPIGRMPRRPITMARFGVRTLVPARRLAERMFGNERARALFAGCAGHSAVSLDHPTSSALGLIFALAAQVQTWPVAKGGSGSITRALVGYLEHLGGEIVCDRRIASMQELPPARAVIFDLSPTRVADIAQAELPRRYAVRLRRYRDGPGTFKVDWALNEEIPWRDTRVATATTVHVGGSLEEIARSEADAWSGRHSDNPFLVLRQQSRVDPSRAPAGKHTGYAYCHVPQGSDRNMTQIIENQVERFAPGFKDVILARHSTFPTDFECRNPNDVGGAITGGAANLSQLFARPVARWNPYTTPNPKLYLCSASTPPGGDVHGMGGYYAARAAIGRLRRGRI
ncbi:MAG: NAD(P)/FAD-dependent oxidoreductase [bacterium]|nr:NAD(P)/FAD-dependent oxidoreductase [bacterium]